MKEFFQWYMVASIVGAWVLIAYAFYRIQKLDEKVVESLKSILLLTHASRDLYKKSDEMQTASRSDAVKLQLANDELGEDLRALKDRFSKALEDISVMREQLLALSKACLVALKESKSEEPTNESPV